METPPANQPRTSPQAIWSLVLGILSNTCLWIFGSIPAISLGILSIRKIDQNPQEVGGKGIAIAGIITGSVGVLVGLTAVGMIAAIMVPAFSTMERNAQLTKQSSEIRQLVMACHAYASDSNEQFPPNLQTLVDEGYLDTDELLTTEDIQSGELVPYEYRPGLKNDGTHSPLILGPITPWAAGSGKRIVGYTDGSVISERVDEDGETFELRSYD